MADIVVDGMELRYSLFCRRIVSILVPADLELLLSLRQSFDVNPIVLKSQLIGLQVKTDKELGSACSLELEWLTCK